MGTRLVLMMCLLLRPSLRGFLLTEACSLVYTASAGRQGRAGGAKRGGGAR